MNSENRKNTWRKDLKNSYKNGEMYKKISYKKIVKYDELTY